MYTYIELQTGEDYSVEYVNEWISDYDNAEFVYSEMINCIHWMIDNHSYKYNTYFVLQFNNEEIVMEIDMKEADERLADVLSFYVNYEQYEKCNEIKHLIDEVKILKDVIEYNEEIINGINKPNCYKIFE